jgi:hypothetical protein
VPGVWRLSRVADLDQHGPRSNGDKPPSRPVLADGKAALPDKSCESVRDPKTQRSGPPLNGCGGPRRRDQCDARLSKSAELLYEPSELAFELFEPAAILLKPFRSHRISGC